MVCWEPVVFKNHLIVDVFVVEYNFAMHNVLKLSLALGHLHSDDVRLTIGYLFFDLVLAERVVAQTIVFSLRILLPTNLYSHLLQSFCCAETMISVAVFYQSVHKLVIKGQSLALIVRTVRALNFHTINSSFIGDFGEAARSFIPLQTRPLKHANDILNRTFYFTIFIGVFDAQNHITSVHFGE